MRRLSSLFKYLQVIVLSLSMLPLSSIAECIPQTEEPGVLSRLMGSVTDAFKRFTDSESIVRYCYMPNTFEPHQNLERFASIPAIPKDFEAACGCFETLSVVPTEQEREQKYNRLKELKYRKRNFEEFIKNKNVVENSMISFITLFPRREIPRACSELVGRDAAIEGSEGCKEDLAKLVNVQLNVEPFVLSPEAQTRSTAVNRYTRRDGGERAPASSEAQSPESDDNDNIVVHLSDSYRAFSRPRWAILRQRAADLAREESIDESEARNRLNIRSITPRDISDYLTSGISYELLDRQRNLALGTMLENNQSLEQAAASFKADQVAPFEDNEIDRAAAKMMADTVRGGASFLNQDFAIASRESHKDLLQNTENNPSERIARIVRLSEARNDTQFSIPPRPFKQPIADPQNPEFLEPAADDDFQKAVFARYEQMARTFNMSNFLRANPDKVLGLGADGVTLLPHDNIDQSLLGLAQEAYQAIDSANLLEAACDRALESRKRICLERSDADLTEETLLPEEINTLAATDLKRGDEVEYGKIVCGSYIDWKSTHRGTIRDFFGLQAPEQTFSAYLESRCDTSSIPKAGDSTPFFAVGCAESTPTPALRPLPPPRLKSEAERNALDAMYAAEDFGSASTLSAGLAALDSAADARPVSLKATASSPLLKPFGAFETTSGGLAGAEERDYFQSKDFVGPPLPPVRPKVRPTSVSLETEVLATTNTNLEPIEAPIPPSSLMGVDSKLGSDSNNYVGAVDADNMSSSGFDMASAFKTNVTDTGRYSIYDNTTVSPLLPEIATAEDYENSAEMDSRDIGRAQAVISQSDRRFDELLEQYEDMKEELESLKGEKADKETNELIVELKKQIAELKDSRKELEAKIEREKTLREIEAAKAVVSATPAQTQPASTRPTFSRPSEPAFRPAPQPTYSAETAVVAPVRVNTPAINSQANYSGASAAARRSFEEAPRLSELSSASISGSAGAANQAAASARVTVNAPSTSGLRLTSQAFDKLSSNDFQSLYESNKGGAIYVEKSVADGNGNRNLVVEKYVPEVIEGEVIYINQGEVAEEAAATEEQEGPSRAIASISEPEVVAEDQIDLRRVKEVARYQDALYSPIHQQLIDKIQAAVAEGRR